MDNDTINQLRKVLELYDQSWEEWLNSDACFLNTTETKVIGYLLAFQNVEESACLLNISRDEYLLVLNNTIEKLEEQQYKYIAWLAGQMVMSN